MTHTLPFGIRSTIFGRLVAGLLLAFTLLTAAGIARTQHAAAFPDFSPPTILSVRLDGATAYVTFRNNGSDESAVRLAAHSDDVPGPSGFVVVDGSAAPGEWQPSTRVIDGLAAGSRYCFWAFALDGNGVIDSDESNVVCADPPAPSAGQTPSLDIRFGPHTASPTCLACLIDSAPVDTNATSYLP